MEAGDTYIIERIDNVPFRQYVKNGYLETALDQMMMRELKAGERGGVHRRTAAGRRRREGGGPGDRGQQGHRCHSFGPLLHSGGSAFSPTRSSTGWDWAGWRLCWGPSGTRRTWVTYGSSEVFEKEGVEAEVAARLDVDKGSFVIGARLLSPTQEGRLVVHWTAVRDMRDAVQEKSDKRIYITPGILELHVRESHYLEAVCENMLEKAVRLECEGPGGNCGRQGILHGAQRPRRVRGGGPERGFPRGPGIHFCGGQGL